MAPTRKKKKKLARRRPPPRRRDEPEPVLAGRLLIGMAVIAAMVVFPWPVDAIADGFVPKSEEVLDTTTWEAGKTVDVEITLITLDYERLGCSSEQEFDGYHCEFKTEKEKWPKVEGALLDDNKKNVIQPYSMSPKNELILVGGLWSMPEVAYRVHQEPFHSIPEKKLARFLAACKVRLIQKVPQMTIRWNKTQRWGKQGPAWVAAAESCQVLEKM